MNILLNVVFGILFYFGLFFIYIFDISNNWNYYGFVIDVNINKLILGLFLSVCAIIFIGEKTDTRNILLLSIVLLFYIPSTIIFSAMNAGYKYLFLVSMSIAIIVAISAIPIKRIVILRLSITNLTIIITICISLVVISIVLQGGLSTFNLNLLDIYYFRREAAYNLPPVFGYIVSPTTKVLIPFIFIVSIYYRSVTIFAIASVLTLLMFGMSHHKTILAAPIAAVLIYYCLFRLQTNTLLAALYLLIPIIGLIDMIVVPQLLEENYISAFNGFIVRRIIFVPPFLDFAYTSFFDEYGYYFWSTSRIGMGIAQNPFDNTAPFVIGEEFFNRVEMSANTGIVGSGFAQAGIIGVAVYSFCTGLVIAALQSYGRAISHPLAIALSFFPIMVVITTTDLTTALLTHGILLLFLLLSLIPRELTSTTPLRNATVQ